jgi:hypothetical protein
MSLVALLLLKRARLNLNTMDLRKYSNNFVKLTYYLAEFLIVSTRINNITISAPYLKKEYEVTRFSSYIFGRETPVTSYSNPLHSASKVLYHVRKLPRKLQPTSGQLGSTR